MTKTMIFDTETSGLIPKETKHLADFPHILQLSFVIYNDETQKIEKTYNAYINAGLPVPEKITELTGITQSMCDGGKPIVNVLYDFYYASLDCSRFVAHNIKFDIRMIDVSIQRNIDMIKQHCVGLVFMFDTNISKKEQFCTMYHCIRECNIICEAKDKNGNTYTYKKFPKLSEAHCHYFGSVPGGLHNSMVDCLVCLRIYLKQRYGRSISDDEFAKWMQ